jgi:hypothetical protein
MRVHWTFVLLTLIALACDDGGGGGIDASSSSDANPNTPDAEPAFDAEPLPACGEDLAPVSPDGSNAENTDPNIVISEIDPGTFIEVYNSGTGDVLLSATGYSWCNNRSYPRFTSHNIVVKPGGRRVINWPGGGGQETGGDVSIYSTASFSNGAKQLSYVCWGNPSNGGSTRKVEAESTASEKWNGACASAIPAGGSLARLPNTEGRSASDFETLTTPTPENCE